MREIRTLETIGLLCVLCLVPGLQLGCDGDDAAADPITDTDADPVTDPDADPGDEDEALPFALTTSAFGDGEAVPIAYECGGAVIDGPGDNISPDLSWTAGPKRTGSYAIVMDDVDSGVVHWVVYDIPGDVLALPEDLPPGYEPLDPAGAKQAELQFSGYYGYLGPCSEFSTNTYRWTVHAMREATVTGADAGTSEYDMVDLIEAESLASASFTGES